MVSPSAPSGLSRISGLNLHSWCSLPAKPGRSTVVVPRDLWKQSRSYGAHFKIAAYSPSTSRGLDFRGGSRTGRSRRRILLTSWCGGTLNTLVQGIPAGRSVPVLPEIAARCGLLWALLGWLLKEGGSGHFLSSACLRCSINCCEEG